MSPQDWRNDVVTVGQTPSFPTESSLATIRTNTPAAKASVLERIRELAMQEDRAGVSAGMPLFTAAGGRWPVPVVAGWQAA